MLLLLISIAVLCLLLKLYLKWSTGHYSIDGSLKGKVVVLTGGNRGIGLQTWRQLALKGATCHVFCRDMVSQQIAWYEVGNLKRAGHKVDVEVYMMDVSSQSAIRKAISMYLAEYDGPIDVLINNAAVGWLGSRRETADGVETTMATNHFGPFLVTHLLLERLLLSPSPRVVNVTSQAHLFVMSPSFMEDLNYETTYNSYSPYNVSKLCNVLFTRECQRRCGGKGINSYAAHPGSVRTDLFRHMPLYERVFIAIFHLFAKDTMEGSQTSLFCALSPSAVPGEYHADCGKAYSSAIAHDMKLAERLWEKSEEVVHLEEQLKV